jgi:hypothetical protein
VRASKWNSFAREVKLERVRLEPGDRSENTCNLMSNVGSLPRDGSFDPIRLYTLADLPFLHRHSALRLAVLVQLFIYRPLLYHSEHSLSPLCLGLARTGCLQVFPVTSIATCCSEDFCWSSLWWMIIVRSEAASRMHVDRSISLACGIFASGTGARRVTTPRDLLHLAGKSHQDSPRKGDAMERKGIP